MDNISNDSLYPPNAPALNNLAAHIKDGHPTDFSFDLSKFPNAASIDPFAIVGPDLNGINANIKSLLGVDHPVLSTVAKYFFEFDGGKKIRPALVLLMAHAVNQHMINLTRGNSSQKYTPIGKFTLSQAEVDLARDLAESGVPTLRGDRVPFPGQIILPLQRRLAEITELIHTASLLHDDVIDGSETRRGVGSVNAVFGNKLAILAGDFLLARASISLARLRNVPVVELLSTVIEHLVKGEVMQIREPTTTMPDKNYGAFLSYLRKTYYKTGSLIANSCKAIALLGLYPDEVTVAAYKYGFHLGIAFQLVDDILDFEGTSDSLGKPAFNDIRCGLSTAPVLYAAVEHPHLHELIERKFKRDGDIETAVQAIDSSRGIDLTRALARSHAQLALDALEVLDDSEARSALAKMVLLVLNRSK